MHGMMKMTEFIKLFGSGINFYAGPGESHHKYFVKAPGDLTQRRVSEFAKQVANRVYETMAFEVAQEGVRQENAKWHVYQGENSDVDDNSNPRTCADHGDDDYVCLGAYRVTAFPLKDDGSPDHQPPRWDNQNAQKISQPQFNLHPRLLKILSREVTKRRSSVNQVRGFTEVRAEFGDQLHIFRAGPWYHGKPWHDWALVSYQKQGRGGDVETRTYLARLCGFMRF